MSRRTIASALCVASLCTATALAQPPKGNDPGGNPGHADTRKALGDWVKPTDKANGIVAAALANDPDVLVARAKVQLAEAELAKARQGVVLKVMTLNATIEEQMQAVKSAQDRYTWAERMMKTGNIPQGQLLDERAKLEAARAALAKAQTELKLLTGGKEVGMEVKPGHAPDHPTAAGIAWLLNAQAGDDSRHAVAQALIAGMEGYRSAHTPKGPVPDRIRAALDKPVKLGTKKEVVAIEKAMEVFKKDAGLDVAVTLRYQVNFVPIETNGEELPVGAWLQMFADANSDYAISVREYGLLVTLRKESPPDAPSLTEFWKQKSSAGKEAKDVPAPKPGK
jgi:hypothetical protein